MSATDIINLPIDEKSYNYAKIYSSLLNDEYQRKRAYASIVALYAFLNILEKSPLNIQKSMTLFRNPIINEQYEIADIYVNNWHLDIRVVNDTDAVLVPKIHYDSAIVPDYYVVIKIDSELKNTELIGFVDTSRDTKEAFDYHYYKVPFSKLINYEEFLDKVKKEKEELFKDSDHELFESSYLSLLDGGLDIATRNEVIKHVFNCSKCRTAFCCFTGFEMVSCNISKYPDLLDDKTLEIIGAQNIDKPEYEGKEETIYIGEDKQIEETSTNAIENEDTHVETQIQTPTETETENKGEVDDILDELFTVEEEVVEEYHTNETPQITKIDSNIEDESTSEIEAIKQDKNEEKDFEIIEDDNSITELDSDNNTSDELNFIDENTVDLASDNNISDGLDIIENSNDTNRYSELDVIDQNTVQDLEDNSDFVVINDLKSDEDNSDLILDTDDEQQVPKEEVQKVIVDYDEAGEPIYSYITSVNQDETDTVNTDYEAIEEIPQDDIELEDYSESDTQEQAMKDEEIIRSEIQDTDEELQEYQKTENPQEINNEDESLTQLKDTDNVEEMVQDKSEDEESQEFGAKEPAEIYSQNVEILPKPEEEINNKDESVTPIQDTNKEEEMIQNSTEDEESQEFEEYNESDDEEQDDEDYESDEEYEEPSTKPANRSGLVLVSLLIALGLLGGGAFLLFKNMQNNSKTASIPAENVSIPDEQTTNDMFEQPVQDESGIEIPQNNEENTENTDNTQESQENNNDMTQQAPMPPQGSIPVPPPIQIPQSNGDVNKAITNAFAQSNSGVSLRGLNWFCTAELFTDPTFKNYLQNLDNSLKQNIRNNIMGVVQTPPNDSVTAKFAVDNNGNLQKVIISDSSGSEEIDNIVLQSINESFQGEKSQILNDNQLKSDMYYLKVVIKL